MHFNKNSGDLWSWTKWSLLSLCLNTIINTTAINKMNFKMRGNSVFH